MQISRSEGVKMQISRYEEVKMQISRYEGVKMQISRCEEMQSRRCESVKMQISRCEAVKMYISKCEGVKMQISSCDADLQMYYNGCFFTKNPSQTLSGKKHTLTPRKLYYIEHYRALCNTEIWGLFFSCRRLQGLIFCQSTVVFESQQMHYHP